MMSESEKTYWPCSFAKVDISEGKINTITETTDDGEGSTVLVLDMKTPETPVLHKAYNNVELKKGFYMGDACLTAKYPQYERNALFKYDPQTRKFTHFSMEKLRKMIEV